MAGSVHQRVSGILYVDNSCWNYQDVGWMVKRNYDEFPERVEEKIDFKQLIFNLLQRINLENNKIREMELINKLDVEFPYKDKKYNEIIEKTRVVMIRKLNNLKNKFGFVDDGQEFDIKYVFMQKKLEELVSLFKRKGVYPRPAEYEVLE